jgi:hypothetical protein
MILSSRCTEITGGELTRPLTRFLPTAGPSSPEAREAHHSVQVWLTSRAKLVDRLGSSTKIRGLLLGRLPLTIPSVIAEALFMNLPISGSNSSRNIPFRRLCLLPQLLQYVGQIKPHHLSPQPHSRNFPIPNHQSTDLTDAPLHPLCNLNSQIIVNQLCSFDVQNPAGNCVSYRKEPFDVQTCFESILQDFFGRAHVTTHSP